MFVPESNFFDEGGHSILAQQLFFRLREEWKDLDVPVSVIFQSQTLAALAAEIDRAQDPIGLRLDAMPLEGDARAGDEAYAADARDLVRQLPESVRSAPVEWGGSPGAVVFLTGATGFLGSYLLYELLEGPAKAKVIAHVRAKDAAAGMARLKASATAYGLWSPSWTESGRVEVVVGDISEPDLGLPQSEWARISDEVDVVIHNGAQVNWMLPYSTLRAANVLSTIACIRLCTSGKKPKRLGFISSTATLDNEHFVQQSQSGTPVSEADDLEGSRKGLATGYGQSKWASEFLVREAGRRGLVGAIVRPGYVTGDPASGVTITDDFLVRLWKGCLQVGARPNIANTVNTVPVTQVARIAVAATLHLPAAMSQSGTSLGVVQVNSRPRLTLNEWIGALETYGYAVPIVSYDEWRTRVKEYVGGRSVSANGKNPAQAPASGDAAAAEQFALLPLFHYVVGDLPADTIAPELDDANASKVMALYASVGGGETKANGTASGAATPPDHALAANAVDLNTLGMYLAYLVAVGFLPPAPPSSPQGTTRRELPAIDAEKIRSLMADGGLSRGGRSAKS